MNNNTNRITNALRNIAATLKPITSRVKAAKLAVLKLMGNVPEGTVTYRSECPQGAGQGPMGHTMAEKSQVGSRTFTRRQARFIRSLRYHPFGRNFN